MRGATRAGHSRALPWLALKPAAASKEKRDGMLADTCFLLAQHSTENMTLAPDAGGQDMAGQNARNGKRA